MRARVVKKVSADGKPELTELREFKGDHRPEKGQDRAHGDPYVRAGHPVRKGEIGYLRAFLLLRSIIFSALAFTGSMPSGGSISQRWPLMDSSSSEST